MDHSASLLMKKYQRLVQEYSASMRRVSQNFSQTDIQSIIIPWEREKKRNYRAPTNEFQNQTSFRKNLAPLSLGEKHF